jgi:hypothetical protein
MKTSININKRVDNQLKISANKVISSSVPASINPLSASQKLTRSKLQESLKKPLIKSKIYFILSAIKYSL